MMKLHKVRLIQVVGGLLAVIALVWTGMQRKASPDGAGFRSGPVTAAELSLHQPISEERPSAAPAQASEHALGGGQRGTATRVDPTADSDPAVREFRLWAGRYAEETDPAAKRALVERGRVLARTHREAIKQLIPTDPQSALRQALPMALRQQLPPEVMAELEERINTRATFGVYAASSGDPEPIRRVVETPARRYKAYVYGRRLTQPTTPDDYLVGIAVNDQMAVDERPLRVLEALEQPDPVKPLVRVSSDDRVPSPAAGEGDGRQEHAAPPFDGKAPLVEAGGTVYQLCCPGFLDPFERELVAFEGGTGGPVYPSYPVTVTGSTGARSVLYLRVAFPDVLLEPQTESAAYDMMSQVSAWFVENSYGNLYLLTTVAPLVVLPRTEVWYRNGGSEYDLRNDALAVAKALGYDGDAHDHVIFAYNGGPGNFNGLATQGGKHVWLKSINVGTAAHELGHNFGLWHANFWNTGGQSVIGDGSNQEYGNIFDTMGPASAGNLHFNAVFKNQLRWLTKEFVHDIRRSGFYRIHAYDQAQLDPAKRYGFKVLKDTQRHYWGEFRQKFGVSNPWLRDGVVLNWSPWSKSAGGTHLLDTTPGTSDGRTDAALTIGRTFSDFEAGVHITPVGKGGTSPESIDVVVNLGTFPENLPPTATVSADQTSIGAGVTVNFTANASDADGDTLAYSWEFGDKTFSNTNSQQTSKSWSTAGDYVVRCLVSDMKGGTASDSVILRIGSPATFAISGQITSGGQPLANVRVHNGQSGSNYRGAYTDSDGTYTITGLSAGNVTLTAVLYGYSFTAGFANPVAVGPAFSGANFTALEAVRVSITTIDPITTEGGDTATIRLARSGPTANALGVAVAGIRGPIAVEYTLVPDLNFIPSLGDYGFVIPAGQSSLDIVIAALNDADIEGPEVLTIEIRSAASYVVTGVNPASVTLLDSDSPLPLVSVDVRDADASETGDGATFLVSRVGSTASALTVRFNLSGSAVNGSDYAMIATSVVIPAGQFSVPIPITPINDSVIEGGEEITVTLSASASYLVSPTAGAASAFIVDDDIPTVTMVATDAAASEVGQDPATFVVTRTGNTSAPLTVNYALSGSAQHGVDYAVLPGVLTLPAGSSSGSITVVPINDDIGEPIQTIGVQIRGGTSYVVGSPASATANLADNDVPVVTVGVSDATCTEPADAGQFKFTTAGTGSGNITVRYTVTGTATSGVDYVALADTLSMGRNTTATVSVAVLDDVLPEDLETITVTIDPDPAYSTFLDKSATLNILDNERNIVNVTPAGGSPGEGNGVSLTYYVSRQGSTASALTVNYGMSGTATNGVDYQALSGTAVILAGQSGVNVTVTITDDSLLEGAETAILTLAPAAAYGLGISSATQYITDNEAPAVQVRFASATGSGSESVGTVNIPVTLSAISADPVHVGYAIAGGSATGGIDYHVVSGLLTFDPGVTSLNIPLTIIDDIFDETAQTVIIELKNAWHASLGMSRYTYTINDDSGIPPPVTVGFMAAASAAGENVSPAVILVSLSASQSTPVTVHYAATGGTATGGGVDYALAPGTLTLAPGETEKQLPITIIDDMLNETDETIIVTLDSPAGATLNANTTHTHTINNIAGILAVTPAAGFDSSGPGGGPFSPARVTYTLSNIADTPLNWTASANADWVGLSTAGGTLNPGAYADVVVSLSAKAETLLPQSYTATLTFTNTTNNNGNTSRDVSLSASPPPPVPNQISLTGGSAVLRFWGVPGTDYQIERSIDLETWIPIGLRTAPAKGIIEFTDTSPPAGKAFYRTATP